MTESQRLSMMLYESRIASLQRAVAFFVMFHQMGHLAETAIFVGVAKWAPFGPQFSVWKSESNSLDPSAQANFRELQPCKIHDFSVLLFVTLLGLSKLINLGMSQWFGKGWVF